MRKPQLSLCIPTYNRSKYLDWLLKHFVEQKQLLSDIEIVISDNCSDDDTEIVVNNFISRLPITYSRNDENIGAKNLLKAYQLASGEYVAYLADDDLIDFKALRHSLSTLRSCPSASALFSPWRSLNLKSRTIGPAFYNQPDSYVVPKGAYFAALDLLCRHHIFPEIGIIRREVTEQYTAPHDFAYCYFVWLSQSLRAGAVLFDRTPYYYSVSAHVCDDGRRSQTGNSQAMTAWDSYRGGYEFLLACGQKSGEKKDKELEDTLRIKINENVLIRMRVAYRMNLLRGNFKAAHLLYMRLCANGVGPEPLIDYEDLCLLANLDDDGNLILKGPIGLSSDVLSRLKGLLEVYFPGQFFLLQNAPLKESAESVVTIGLGSVESKKPLLNIAK